jgi:hypothetical protein
MELKDSPLFGQLAMQLLKPQNPPINGQMNLGRLLSSTFAPRDFETKGFGDYYGRPIWQSSEYPQGIYAMGYHQPDTTVAYQRRAGFMNGPEFDLYQMLKQYMPEGLKPEMLR